MLARKRGLPLLVLSESLFVGTRTGPCSEGRCPSGRCRDRDRSDLLLELGLVVLSFFGVSSLSSGLRSRRIVCRTSWVVGNFCRRLIVVASCCRLLVYGARRLSWRTFLSSFFGASGMVVIVASDFCFFLSANASRGRKQRGESRAERSSQSAHEFAPGNESACS